GWLIFAGAAQFTAVSLLGTGAGPVAAASAALIINSRHVMYSAALVPRFRTQPRWFQWLGPYVLVDQVFALGTGNVDADDVEWRSYYLGAGGFAWMAWQLAMGVGILIGPVLPDGLDLTFAIPAMFLGLLVVGIRSKAGAVAAVVGAVVTAALWQFGNGGGLLVGSIAGSVAGYLVDRRSDR
ncbi:MAG: branched-chain amino acid permease, partial [Acidimicrobiia bacterium]|nr:branched-chain amino acid permease [Acidimicrobiia bacterium]